MPSNSRKGNTWALGKGNRGFESELCFLFFKYFSIIMVVFHIVPESIYEEDQVLKQQLNLHATFEHLRG
ncbi:unnamed protein product [Angiostrongylus costaricensis]|uniref:Uncharacterized protein n=1 Tax=Angiostrongylus costaricensis TaxID=334426 RepID=A0A0R3PT15_ANGCS|nr:unnamed protein product [Angiostrongylus costaricensis]